MNNKNFNSQTLTYLISKISKILIKARTNWLSLFKFYGGISNLFNFQLKKWESLKIKNKHLKNNSIDFDSINHSPLTGNFSGGENSNIYLGDFLKRSSEIIPLLSSETINENNKIYHYSNFLIKISNFNFSSTTPFLIQNCPIDLFKGNGDLIFRFPILRIVFNFKFEISYSSSGQILEENLNLFLTMKQVLKNQKFNYLENSFLNSEISFENTTNKFKISYTPSTNLKTLSIFIFREINLNDFLQTLYSNSLFSDYSFNDSYDKSKIPSSFSIKANKSSLDKTSFSFDSFKINSYLISNFDENVEINFLKGYGYSFLIKRSKKAFWGSTSNFIDKFFYLIN